MKTLCRSNWFPFNGLLFLGVVCDYQRDIYWGFFVCRLIESSYALFSRRLRRSRRGMQQAALVKSKTIYPNPLLQDEEYPNNVQSRSLFHGLE